MVLVFTLTFAVFLPGKNTARLLNFFIGLAPRHCNFLLNPVEQVLFTEWPLR